MFSFMRSHCKECFKFFQILYSINFSSSLLPQIIHAHTLPRIIHAHTLPRIIHAHTQQFLELFGLYYTTKVLNVSLPNTVNIFLLFPKNRGRFNISAISFYESLIIL